MTDPMLRQFMSPTTPPHPLPWHNHNNEHGPRDHLTTEKYARILLDALAGDERRVPLRRVYRFFMIHDQPFDSWRTTSRWMLIEAMMRYMYVLPPNIAHTLKDCKSFKEIGE